MKGHVKIGLGSVQFGMPYGISNQIGQTSMEEVSRILDLAYAKGIRFLDTASGYGTSQAVIGKFHQNRFSVISKFMPPSLEESVEIQLDKSLFELQLNSLYGYLAHRPLELLKDKKTWNTLQELKAIQKIQKIGFSLNSPQEYEVLKAAGFIPDLVQVPFNYLDTRFRNCLVELKANGCEVHTRSAFLQGLFFTKTNELPEYFKDVKPFIDTLQLSYGEQLQGALLKYVIQQEFIDVVIIGVENQAQLNNNLVSVASAPDLQPLGVTFSDKLLMPLHWPKN